MSIIRLNWGNPNAAIIPTDGFRVFRSTAVFDVNSLPIALVELAPDVTTFTDNTALSATEYFYAVGGFLGSEMRLSPVITISTLGFTEGNLLLSGSIGFLLKVDGGKILKNGG